MLGKLIGYEMRAFGRIILPLYAATIGMALLIGLGVRFLPEDLYSNMFGGIVLMIFVSLIITTMAMTGILCVQRFYQNLLANEGYLMFSLPVGTHQLILSKVLGSIIWTLLGGVAAFCTVLSMELAAVPMKDTVDLIRKVTWFMDKQMLGRQAGAFILWALIAILMFTAMLMQIYAALAIGHQWSSHRILGSVLAYFGIDILKSMFSGILARFGVYTGIWGIMISESGDAAREAALTQAVAAGSSLFYIVVFSLVTWYFLDRRLNLE